MGINVCRNCDVRHVGCHSTCEDYIEAVKHNERIKAEKRKDILYQDYAIEKDFKYKKLERDGRIKNWKKR